MLTHVEPSAGLSPISTMGLIQKIQTLPPERLAEVDDFVEFLRLRMVQTQAYEQDRALTRMAAQASAHSFASVWDNPEDEAYDAL
jgi:Protein of unknown function (DUF2281)